MGLPPRDVSFMLSVVSLSGSVPAPWPTARASAACAVEMEARCRHSGSKRSPRIPADTQLTHRLFPGTE
jgi:hypothetical protein